MQWDRGEIDSLFETVSPGGPESAVGFVMWRVVRRYLRSVDRSLAPLELTHLKFQALALIAWLAPDEAAISQARLSDFSDIQPMQVSLLLKALEKQSLVRRVRGSSDPRTKNVELTDLGWDLLRAALPVVIGRQEEFFGDQSGPEGALLPLLLRLDRSTTPPAPGARP